MGYDEKLKEIRNRLESRKTSVREDYGVKGMKWGEHKAEESTGSSSGTSGNRLGKLPEWEQRAIKQGLSEGNTYTFAHAYLELYPEEAEKSGFDLSEAVNSYKSWVDYNDGIFTFRHPNGDKDFFDAEMNYKGTKKY